LETGGLFVFHLLVDRLPLPHLPTKESIVMPKLLGHLVPEKTPVPEEVQDARRENIDLIKFERPGPFLARIKAFSDTWFENDARPGEQSYRVLASTPGAIPRMSITVVFEQLLTNDGSRPLELSKDYRPSYEPHSMFAQVIAALAGCSPGQLAQLAEQDFDLDTLVNRHCNVLLRADKRGIARIKDISPLPLDASVRSQAGSNGVTFAVRPLESAQAS
jgi:hypothetical protein